MSAAGTEHSSAAAGPLITVTITTYNRASLLPEAIDRVLAQGASGFDDFELVIVDDGSTDDTASVVRAHTTDPRVRLVSRSNGGLCAGRNTGAQAARGRHIIFLDDDDLPDDDWLSSFAEVLERDDPAVACCGCRLTDPATLEPFETWLPKPIDASFGDGRALFVPGTFSVRADVFEASGGFVEGLQCSHQTEYSWRLLPLCHAKGWTISSIDRPLLAWLRRPVEERAEMAPAKLLQGSEYLLDAHADYLASRPVAKANVLGVAGVAAARLGDYRTARAHFRDAVRLGGVRDRTSLGRLALAYVPPLGRRVWGDSSGRVDPTRSPTPLT